MNIDIVTPTNNLMLSDQTFGENSPTFGENSQTFELGNQTFGVDRKTFEKKSQILNTIKEHRSYEKKMPVDAYSDIRNQLYKLEQKLNAIQNNDIIQINQKYVEMNQKYVKIKQQYTLLKQTSDEHNKYCSQLINYYKSLTNKYEELEQKMTEIFNNRETNQKKNHNTTKRSLLKSLLNILFVFGYAIIAFATKAIISFAEILFMARALVTTSIFFKISSAVIGKSFISIAKTLFNEIMLMIVGAFRDIYVFCNAGLAYLEINNLDKNKTNDINDNILKDSFSYNYTNIAVFVIPIAILNFAFGPLMSIKCACAFAFTSIILMHANLFQDPLDKNPLDNVKNNAPNLLMIGAVFCIINAVGKTVEGYLKTKFFGDKQRQQRQLSSKKQEKSYKNIFQRLLMTESSKEHLSQSQTGANM